MNTYKLLIERIIQGILVLWGIVTLTFILRHLTPTSPARLIAPPDAQPETIDNIRRELGLDEPLTIQYIRYITNILQGDFGTSFTAGEPVLTLIARTLPNTFELAVTSLAFATIISIPLGIISAKHRGEFVDNFSNIFSLSGLSTPNFWLAIMLVLLLSVQIGILPTSGRVPITESFTGWLRHILLPTVALGTYFTALLFRMTRNGVIAELGKEYVVSAHTRGLPSQIVMYRYVLQNSIAPVVTVAGIQFGVLIGGSVVVETIFNWPGVGLLFIRSLRVVDWPTMQGILITVGAVFVIINILVDIFNAKLNPQETI